MLKPMAWSLLATLTLAAPLAQADGGAQKVAGQPAVAPPAVAAPAPHLPPNPAALIAKDVARGERPTSTPRNLAPDAYPSNVVKILRTTNKAQTTTYIPVVFDFTQNNPFNVIRFLHRPVQTEEGALFTFVNPDGTGGKVLFVVPDYMVPSLAGLVEAVDRPKLTTSAGDKRVYRQLKHRRADISDPGFLETAASFSTGNGSIFLTDPRENALYYEDAPSGADALDAALTEWLDVPTAMLELVVKIYEVDAVNDTQIGLDYMAWRNGPGANLFAVGAYAEHGGFPRHENVQFPPIGTGADGLPRKNFTAYGYNYAFRYDVPSAFFDFLAVKGKARILNEMKLAALNTRPASLSAGDQILYYAVATSEPSGVRASGEPLEANPGRVVVGTTNAFDSAGDLTPVETGLSLDVVPIIGEQTVQLDLAMTWSDYAFSGDDGFPQINRHSLTSDLRCKLGDEIIIGGLNRQVNVKSTRKAPILGSIPILGYAFGGETSSASKTEMIVVIQPTAVFNYNLAKTEAERDYRVTAAEQAVIDQASGVAPIAEPKAGFGFDQLGLDKERGVKAK